MSDIEESSSSSHGSRNYEQIFDEEGYFGQELTLDKNLLQQIEKLN